MSNIYVFDCEVFINYFSVIFKCIETKELTEFIIFEDKNDLPALYKFIDDRDKWFVGYNSFSFDNQLLKYIHSKYFDFSMTDSNNITMDIHNLAMAIINSEFQEYRYSLPFKWIDLMKVGAYQKSLKLIGVSMKWPKIQDLPIPPESIVKRDQVNMIREYNLNDVLITEQLYYKLLDRLKLRAEISRIYDINVYSESDSGIANRILEKTYSEITGLEMKHFKGLRTERKFINFNWVVFPEINFDSEVLMNLLEEIKNHTYYEKQPFFKKKVAFDCIEYNLGVGGIHSKDHGALFETNEHFKIIDCDVSSMYPATAINHNLTPEHLGSKFIKNFRDLRDKRIKAKREGRTIENEALKLVLNATIGKTLNKHLWLYDPIVNLKVTINGQLFIMMLIEKLVLAGFRVISANTDGIVTLVETNRYDEYKTICKEWETLTRYELEFTEYQKYIRRDVNNYIAIKTNGEVKCKGIFLTNIDLAKGYDQPIISTALYEYFVNSKPIDKTIKEHQDIYDFCTAKKIDKKFTNEYHYLTNSEPCLDKIQQSVRYYVSTTSGKLFKVDENKNREEYEVNKTVTIFNDYFKSEDYKIDYGYYINKTQKIIDEIINPQLTLF